MITYALVRLLKNYFPAPGNQGRESLQRRQNSSQDVQKCHPARAAAGEEAKAYRGPVAGAPIAVLAMGRDATGEPYVEPLSRNPLLWRCNGCSNKAGGLFQHPASQAARDWEQYILYIGTLVNTPLYFVSSLVDSIARSRMNLGQLRRRCLGDETRAWVLNLADRLFERTISVIIRPSAERVTPAQCQRRMNRHE